MEINLSQSSCEIIKDIKNLEVCSEGGDFSSQDIANAVEKLNVNNSSQETELPEKIAEDSESSIKNSSSSESTESSGTSSSSSSEPEPIVKRKRKRKRKRKAKVTIGAYEPPKPFTARYKKLKLFEPVLPKLHIRFDDGGFPDQQSSEYNLRPRIIHSLKQNLLISERLNCDVKTACKSEEKSIPRLISKESFIENVFSLKPRIIKAIIT